MRREPVLAFLTRKGLAGDNIYIRRTPKHRHFLSKLQTLGNNNTHYNEDLFCLARLYSPKEQYTEFMAQYEKLLLAIVGCLSGHGEACLWKAVTNCLYATVSNLCLYTIVTKRISVQSPLSVLIRQAHNVSL
jgi:hypothetical protein